ncbi:methyl-accepting chemotaxis protein [Anaerocolumna sp. AGMB13025]|uniref:methyl-accepting chemotaxis protein n=1 Tax=Anaerocolumna sp. AGMB13025 TaxID=3039116 RepID=UPI00241D74D9|nr:methyl-accepting chemotaxis protein [Anaerocolumna sp. AGMB13025]WFR57492.1 methyl-accepting chemotaxis protein [Anaerocolumna sp. AGMB13025]
MKIGLSKRIGAFIGILVLFVSIIIGFLGITYSSKALLKNQEESIKEIAKDGAGRVQEIISMRLLILSESANADNMKFMDWNTQKAALSDDVKRLEYLDMAVLTPDGKANYVLSGETADLSDREYFKKALKGEANVSDVLISKVTNTAVIMYAAPIMDGDKVVGVLVGRRDGTALNDITDQLGMGERGYAFIIGSDATMYAHPNRDLVMNQVNVYKEIEDNGPLKTFGLALKKLGTGKEGILRYSYNGEKRITAMAPIPGSNWTLAIGNYESEVLKEMNTLRGLLTTATAVVLILGAAAGIAIGLYITKPVVHLQKSIEKLSVYDFSPQTDKKDGLIERRRDEIGNIARSLTVMKNNITNLIKIVAANSEQVAASSQELTSTSRQSAESAGEVARTIEEIARGASDQAKETETGTGTIQELGDIITQDQQYLNELNDYIKNVTTLKDTGLETVTELSNRNRDSSTSAKEIQSHINETAKSAEKIQAASLMIKSIAAQTNLLALNAAIEAARAGEAGRGFSVVAEEIRNLAEQSNNFTDEISVVMKDLTDKTEASVKAIEAVESIMEAQTVSVTDTSQKFDGISAALEHMQELISNLNHSGARMLIKKDEIISTMENLSAISEENAAGTEEASASMEEQTAAMDEIANASESLAELAQELQTEIGKFRY